MNRHWSRFWMRFSRFKALRKTSTKLAAWGVSPLDGREQLAYLHRNGYVSRKAKIYHGQLSIGNNVFIDDGVEIYQSKEGGSVKIGNKVCIYRDTIIETGLGGNFSIGDHSSIHPRSQINAYAESIRIGRKVMIAANCALYPYDHSIEAGTYISEQPLQSKGPISIGDGAWLGYGVIVLSGVSIGEGAVIGAGSIVTKNIPDDAVAIGSPAKVIKMRTDTVSK